MGHAADRAKSLMQEDEEFSKAIAIIRDFTEDGDEVEWRDVKEDLTSGQWGRLIQEGVLESGEEGFVLADPSGIQEVLDEGYEPLTLELEDIDAEVNWTIYDKIAGLVTISFFVAYWYDPFRDQIGQTINLVIAPIESSMPFFSLVLVLALVTGLYSALLQANLMDREVIGAYQEQMQTVQERRKAAEEAGDEEALERIQEQQLEAMGGMLEMFKAQFRPMVWIMVLTIPVFLWLWWFVGTGDLEDPEVVMPFLGEARWDGTLIGPMPTWILWYILCSIGFGQLIRKVLNIRTSPSS